MLTVPLTTVLIDTYNYGHFIEQAIDSVLSQDFPSEHLEIIVVDDGSTDDTAERLSRYGSRIKYLQKPNGGQASAFNLGFAHARGDFIVLLDADDFFLPGKLRRVFDEFQSHPEVGMIYHRLPQMHSGGVIIPVVGFEPLSGFLPADNRILSRYTAHQTSCLAFRRSALLELLPIPESMRLQADAYLELVAILIKPVLAIQEDLAVYRIHGENLFARDYMASSAEGVRRLVLSSNIVRREVHRWITTHRQYTRNVNTRRLLDRLVLPLTERQFQFEPPDRFHYFAFLLRRNYAFGPKQAWYSTTLKYIVAFAAPFLGYENYRSVYTWCGKTLNALHSLAGQRR